MVDEVNPNIENEKKVDENSEKEEKIPSSNEETTPEEPIQPEEPNTKGLLTESIEKNEEITENSIKSLENNRELTLDDIENIDELMEEVDVIDETDLQIEQNNTVDDVDDEVKVISVKELTERTVKRNTIEAALLAAQRPIGIEEISIKLEMSKSEIQNLIQELAEDYMDRTTAIEIVQIGEGYSMQIKPEYTEKITKFASGGLIPKAVMRTLTIIAVKQPILKSLLVKMRGSTAYEHCKFLIDRGYISAYKKGRSSILETTDQFADTFGLSRNVETLKSQLIEQLDIQSSEEETDENEDAEEESEDITIEDHQSDDNSKSDSESNIEDQQEIQNNQEQ